MDFNNFVSKILDLTNQANGNIKVTFSLQKGYIIDILVSVYDDVIVDTSIDIYSFPEAEKSKMAKIINAIGEYC